MSTTSTCQAALQAEGAIIKRLKAHHREIARRIVLGQKASDIAKDLGLSISRISVLKNSPLMQAEIARLEKMRDDGVQDVRVQLEELAPTMLAVCERTALMAKSERLRLSAAQDLLDRAGYNKVHKVDSISMTETYEQRLQRLLGIDLAEGSRSAGHSVEQDVEKRTVQHVNGVEDIDENEREETNHVSPDDEEEKKPEEFTVCDT